MSKESAAESEIRQVLLVFAYMFAHEAHHRGQIVALAHQLGYRLPENVANGVWRWDGLWEQLGFERGPR